MPLNSVTNLVGDEVSRESGFRIRYSRDISCYRHPDDRGVEYYRTFSTISIVSVWVNTYDTS